jgi:hypothetical protein
MGPLGVHFKFSASTCIEGNDFYIDDKWTLNFIGYRTAKIMCILEQHSSLQIAVKSLEHHILSVS